MDIKHRTTGEVLRRLRTQSLADAQLAGAELLYAALPQAELAGADLRGVDFSNADLRRADGRGTDWTAAAVINVDLQESTLSRSRWVDARVLATRFTRADLTGSDMARLLAQWADFRHACLRDVLFEHANLARAVLVGADLSGADLTETDLRHADLSAANLRGATLVDANLTGATLCGADLRDADLTSANFNGADLATCNFAGATLAHTVFTRCRNLASAVGLDAVQPAAPSCIDLHSLIDGGLPESFLEACGLAIEHLGRLRAALGR
jgi:uncharacterized protein YjbI with pentapeptide repeats